jgi:hypothetical protein
MQMPDAMEMGNDRGKVFHMLDQQGSDHAGPLLVFKPRVDAEQDLRYAVVE